jgi:exonuclease SbcD
MPKLCHITDEHLGGTYAEKAAKSFEFLIQQFWEDPLSPAYNPDLIYSTGDLTDRALHVHSEHLRPFLDFVKAARCPIILLQGTMSHEPFGTINNIASISDGKIHIIDSPFQNIKIGGFSVFGIPGITKALVSNWCRARDIQVDGFTDPREGLRQILKDVSNNWASGIRILGGHLTVSGAVASNGQVMNGNDIDLSLEDLVLAKPHTVVLGHIHQYQTWTVNGIRVTYGSSSHPCNFGELDPKGFSVYEFSADGSPISFQRIPYPHKPMVKVDIQFTGEMKDGEWEHFDVSGIDWNAGREARQNAEVKCCYSIPKEIAATVDDAYVRLLFAKHGIDLAAVQRTIQATGRERIPEIGTKETTREQYEAVCEAKGEEPRAGALEKADELDTEVAL